MEFDPKVIIALIDEALEKRGVNANTKGLEQLSKSVVESLIDKSHGSFASNYLYKIRKEAMNKDKKNELISIYIENLDSVAKYLGYENFREFKNIKGYENTIPTHSQHSINSSHKPGDTYDRLARYLPTSIICFPFFFLLKSLIPELNIAYLILAYPIIVVALSYLVADLSKYWEVKYFLKKKGFPTTYFMLYAHPEFPVELKVKYRNQVEKNFNLKIPEREKEQVNDKEVIKVMNIATKFVISITQTSKIQMLLVRYGLARNFTGGSILGSLFSLVIAILYSYQNLSLMLPVALLVSFLVIFFSKKYFITKTAESYARELLITFLK